MISKEMPHEYHDVEDRKQKTSDYHTSVFCAYHTCDHLLRPRDYQLEPNNNIPIRRIEEIIDFFIF